MLQCCARQSLEKGTKLGYCLPFPPFSRICALAGVVTILLLKGTPLRYEIVTLGLLDLVA